MSQVEPKPGFKDWLRHPVFKALVALILVIGCGIVFSADGAFFREGTHRDALRQMSVYGILACGMTVVVISGGIDLAVGSVLALVAVFISLTSIHWNWPFWTAVPAALLVGSAAGAVSGTLVSWGRMQAFIATLAVMVSCRGLAKLISGGTKVSTIIAGPDGTFSQADVPALFRFIDSRVLGGKISVVTLVFLVCFGLTLALLSAHKWGREVYAIGGNEEAARLSGVPVQWSKLSAYVLSGLFAAVAGICQAAQEQQGDPEAGTGYELTAIAIVVMGGTSLLGGRGGVGLTLLGMLTIGYLEKILSINAVPEAGRLILTGIIVVIAVLAQRSRQN